MILGVVLLAYIVPFVLNYITIRNEYKDTHDVPDAFDFLTVVLPVFNLFIAGAVVLCLIFNKNTLRKFFMLNK